MLKRFFAAYRLELRLICLHWSFLVLHVLWAVYVLSSFVNISDRTPQSLLLSTITLSGIWLISIAVMFLSAVSASRGRRVHFDALEAALPIGAEVVIARWLALVTIGASFLIVPLGVAATSGTFADFLAALPTFLVEALLILAISSALVWLLAVFVGIRRWMYPLLGVIWLGSAIFPSTLNVELFPWALLLSFTANAWNGFFYFTLWGRLTLGSLPAFTTICYTGVTLLTGGVIAWRVVQRRRYRHAPLALAAAALGAVVMLVGGFGYSAQVQATNDQRDRINANVLANYLPDSVTLPADVPYVPTRYDLALDLSDFAAPTFTLALTIDNRGDVPLQDLVFTLNGLFEIVAADVPYERHADDLRLRLPEPLAPGGETTISLTYGGAVWWYGGSYQQGRPAYVNDFIDPQGVNLSCPLAWYPVPGHNLVGRTQFFTGSSTSRFTPDCILSEPAAFTLRVTGVDDSPLRWASNLAAQASDPRAFSGAATWAHLMASPILVREELAGGTVTLVTAESAYDAARSAVENSYAPALEHFRRYFPDVSHLTLFVTEAGFGSGFENYATPGTSGDLTVVVSPFYAAGLDENAYLRYQRVAQPMLDSLFGLGDNRYLGSTAPIDNVGFFMWIDFLANGDAAQMLDYLENDLPQGGRTSIYFSLPPAERYAIARALYDVYVEQGEAAVADVIRQIRADAARFAALSPEAAIQWIEEAAGNAN